MFSSRRVNLNPYVAIGRAVREARELREYRQIDLAAKLSISRSALARLEAGKRPLYWHEVQPLCDALGVDYSYLEVTNANNLNASLTDY